MKKYGKIVFINYRLRKDGEPFMCWLPMLEMFVCKAVRRMNLCESAEIYTLYTHETASAYYDAWEDADLFVFWETYARSARYVDRYFKLARQLKERFGKPVLFGGYWATSYGEYFEDFRVFDSIIRGYSINGVSGILQEGFDDRFVRTAFGPSGYDAYDLDPSFIATSLDKYIVFGILQGYFSSFGCPKQCKFCVNDSYRELGTFYSPRSEEKICNDIRSLAAVVDFKGVNFKDSNFFCDKKRAEACFRVIQGLGKDVYSNLDVTIADANESLFSLIRSQTPERNLFFGLESFFPEERERLGKPFTKEKMISFFDMAQRHGFIFSGNLMLGFPFQSAESILHEVREAIEYMHKYPGLKIRVNAYIPKYGTRLQKECFSDLHERIDFMQLLKIYKSQTEEFQDLLYGDRHRPVSIEFLKKGFEALSALRILRQHVPPFLQPVWKVACLLIENHLVKGAQGRLINVLLKKINPIKTRRMLTRLFIRYNRLARVLPSSLQNRAAQKA